MNNRSDSTPGPRPARTGLPPKQGLYDPWFEHDACGVGFVVDIKGRRSHQILQQALQVLTNLDHRGASGSEPNTGDGAGVLLQMPHVFFKEVCKKARIALPEEGEYGSGLVFLPKNITKRRRLEERFEQIIQSEGQTVLGWRTVPTSNAALGETARSCEPAMRQVFIGRSPELTDPMAFERKLYVIRKRAHNEIRTSTMDGAEFWYLCSLSYKTFVYKGMLLTTQLDGYFPDLLQPTMETALALVHSRFSTNTFPSWNRAHPYRYLAHNGEINTLRGNINWMHARQALFVSEAFGEDITKVLPIIDPNGSDTAMFDNTLELLVLAGRPLAHAMMMMIPEPWSYHETMEDDRRAFYQFHSCLMEPWDGPASIAFTDGRQIGAVLDRNGLRPSRYYVTKDGLVIMASEAGVLEIPPERILQKGRLQPGRMFLVDTVEGRIIDDTEIKAKIVAERPYRQWLNEHLMHLDDLPEAPNVPAPDHATLLQRQIAFGYTHEDERIILTPMARDGVEAVGSMGNDAALAVLSNRPRLLPDYFKQLFAQVTNPPIDCIREEIITSAETRLGSEGNLLHPEPTACRRVELKWPVLTNEEFAKIRRMELPGLKVGTLPILFRVTRGERGLAKSMEELCVMARRLIEEDEANVIILSDRGVTREFAPIPALLAIAGLHHYLIREGLRTRASLILETGEAREVHHFALLIGYGCSAVNPYVAFETIDDMIREDLLPNLEPKTAFKNFVKAASKGVVKVMSKMGISSIQSYRGAQVFEAVGLRQDVIDHYFTWTPSRVGGIGLDVIAQEVLARHRAAYPERQVNGHVLPSGGQYKWRDDGEYHLFNPETIHRLQKAVRTGSSAVFRDYARLVNEQSRNLCTLRGLLEFKAGESVPLEEVEPVEVIMKRFKTGAMSYGSISKEAHETLAIAMNRIGGKSNTGEGGEDPLRYEPLPNGDSKNSAIKQVASGRFGVTSEYLVKARELQIKMAQGAKPGEGGQLPGAKVYPWIAKVRLTTAGVGLISPPPHHDIYSIEDLAELIHDLKNANRQARISVKLVAEVGVGTVAAGVAKAHADVVLICGHDGGTGASPQTSIKHAGLPWELGLAETHQTLVLNNLRSRIAVETDGQLKTGRDVVIAALLGAEEFGFATAPACLHGLHHDARLPPEHLPGRHRHPGSAAAGKIRRQAGARRELHALHRRGGPRAHGAARFPHRGGDDRPRRPARAAQGHRALEGEGAGLLQHPLRARRRPRGGALLPDPAGPRAGGLAGSHRVAQPVRAGGQARRAGGGGTADPQRSPRGRHHHRQRGHAAMGRGRPARGHHPHPLQGVGGPELRGFHAEGDDLQSGGRRQRLPRQGALRRQDHRLPARRFHVRARRKYHHRQRRLVRGHWWRGLHPRHGRGTFLRAQLRRQRRGRGGGRPRVRVHDRGPGRGARPDRAQLRRGHVRRHRLRAR